MNKEKSVIYVVEPIETKRPPKWGDVDPVSKELTGRYNGKTPGACKPSESIITEENGYENIELLNPGVSPFDVIKQRENNN